MYEQYIFENITSHEIAISSLIVSILLAWAFHLKILWKYRKLNSVLVSVAIGISAGLVIVSGFNLAVLILIIVALAYRLFSYLRVIKNRDHPDGLRIRSLRTELFMGGFIVLLVTVEVYSVDQITLNTFVLLLSILQIIFSCFFIFKVLKSVKTTKSNIYANHIPDTELPSLTIALPARNETDELTQCLRSLLSTDYPKMEIIVYDDCSQDSTSDIIKSFAHKGVRFIEGKMPTDSWLAKNFAGQQLLDESEGKLILFCGVDVRFDKGSVRSLVENFINSKKTMISVMPTRTGVHDFHQIIQPMRYWREVAIPNIFAKKPPVLSTCWIIERKFLEKIGGFLAYKRSIRPEKHFAKRSIENGTYAFLRSSSGLGFDSVKSNKNQIQTAIRTRYPEHRKRPENIFMFTVWFVAIFIAPFFVMVGSLLSELWLAAILSGLATLSLLLVHYVVELLVNGRGDFVRLAIFPLSVVSEIVLINYSMWAYEFSEVIWKGRNICLPVLKIVPKLPNIDKI